MPPLDDPLNGLKQDSDTLSVATFVCRSQPPNHVEGLLSNHDTLRVVKCPRVFLSAFGMPVRDFVLLNLTANYVHNKDLQR